MPEGFVKSKFQMLVIISFKLKFFLCNYTLYLLVKQAFVESQLAGPVQGSAIQDTYKKQVGPMFWVKPT